MIYQVPQNHVIIIERLGKYSETKSAGLRIRLPFVEAPKDMSHWAGIATKRKRLSYILISQQEQVMDTESQPCITRDNITTRKDLAGWWELFRDGADPVVADEDRDFVVRNNGGVDLVLRITHRFNQPLANVIHQETVLMSDDRGILDFHHTLFTPPR